MGEVSQVIIAILEKIAETDAETLTTSIVSIFSVILGALLGWLLNVLSQKGKLYFTIEFKDSFTKDYYGEEQPSTSKEDTVYYGYSLKLVIFNNSQNAQAVHSIKLQLHNGRKLVQELPFVERDGEKGVETPVCINPKSIETIELHYRWPLDYFDNSEGLWTINQVYFIYTDKKGKIRRKKIKKVNYNNYFRKDGL